ncbi:hypothetical protein LOD99_6573 [Oopsacas minuta]|uniref:Methyltransferase domain-containing protein n=1 Tax=Oopsacas minuta TaxID=111878 RepID=A0AAV7JLS0_9METZ|nr:hypothetical protein LOD99_6573 [Oopsacas minuta]
MAGSNTVFSESDKESELYNWTVKRHHGITVEEVKQIHGRIAGEYEGFYVKTGWKGHIHGAKLLDDVLSKLKFNKDCKILDVGAGTGLVGEEMHKFGYSNITGIDLSEKMLEEASKKGIYKELNPVDMYKDDLSNYSNNFDTVISIGTFTAGQLRPEIMQKVAKFVRTGGVVCFSIRDITWEDTELGFAKQVEEMEKTGVWTVLEKRCLAYHSELGENAYYIACKVN